MADALRSYVFNNRGTVAAALNGLGLCHLSPCTDVGFKKIMNGSTAAGKERAIRFVSAFCKTLDRSADQACRMSGDGRILANRTIAGMEKIPESLGYHGEVVVPPAVETRRRGGGGHQTGLPAHPKIDSGFIATLNDNPPTRFKIGIEMQVRDEGNMAARVVDYGTRIFGFKKTEGRPKTYELALVRWGVEHAANTILSVFGVNTEMCDPSALAGTIGTPALCCVHIFLGASVNIMDRILNVLRTRYPQGTNDLTEADKEAVRQEIATARNAERDVLIEQMRIFLEKENAPFEDWTAEEKDCVNRIGFFKYGHLMSSADVDALDDEDLKNDYECLKIKEKNIMNNINDVEAIWGKIGPYTGTVWEQINQRDAQINQRDVRIAELERQLAEANAPRHGSKTGVGRLARRAIQEVTKPKVSRRRGRTSSGSPSEDSSNMSVSQSESSPTKRPGRESRRSRGRF